MAHTPFIYDVPLEDTEALLRASEWAMQVAKDEKNGCICPTCDQLFRLQTPHLYHSLVQAFSLFAVEQLHNGNEWTKAVQRLLDLGFRGSAVENGDFAKLRHMTVIPGMGSIPLLPRDLLLPRA
jgi:hypothetical protein